MYSVFESPVVTLSVGPTERKFHLHARIVEDGLTHILRPAKGNLGQINIQENIADIFGQVCEYLYTGDYSVGCSKSFGDTEENGTAHDHCIGQFEADGDPNPWLKANIFLNVSTIIAKSNMLTMSLSSVPASPSCGKRDFLCKHPDTLVLHLRLHVFAEKHGMTSLSLISLDKLLHTLAEFPMDRDRVDDIVQLFRLASESGIESDIFIMILQYVSSRLQFLMCRPSLAHLLHERPDLNFELLKYLAVSTQSYSHITPMCKFVSVISPGL